MDVSRSRPDKHKVTCCYKTGLSPWPEQALRENGSSQHKNDHGRCVFKWLAVSYILASCYLHSGWLTFIPESLYERCCAAPIVPLLSLFVDWWLRTIDPPLAQDQDDGVCADALPLTDPKNMLFFSPLNLVFQPTPSFLQTFPSVFFTRRELLMNLNPIHCVLSTSFLPHY